MKKNLPITTREAPFPKGRYLVSRTDLKGVLTYVNDTFLEISGFPLEELIGKSHNVVRHPDMPELTFAWLWQTIKRGQPWRGLVKNRCKNGDFYWVEALVVPVLKDNQIIGYMSVRSEPSRAQITEAEALYSKLQKGEASIPKVSFWQKMSLKKKLMSGVLLTLAVLSLLFIDILAENHLLPVRPAAQLLSGGIFLALLTNIYLLIAQNRVIGYIDKLSTRAKLIAQGDLTENLPLDRFDELGQLNDAFITMQTHLKSMMEEIGEAAKTVKNNANELESRMANTLEIATHQSDALTQIAAGVEELVTSITHVADGAKNTSQSVGTSRTLLDVAVKRMGQSKNASEQVVSSVSAAEESMGKLFASINEIVRFTEVVRGIADQTNLLALNASIEAARAGDSGRGFAVVADEVRKLAENSSKQTEEISASIGEIERVTKNAADAMHAAGKQVGNASGAAESARSGLDEVSENGNVLTAISTQIAESTFEQSNVGHAIARQVEEIVVGIEKTTTEIDNAAEQAKGMESAAERLQEMVSYFRYMR